MDIDSVSNAVIGAAIRGHTELGPGLPEVERLLSGLIDQLPCPATEIRHKTNGQQVPGEVTASRATWRFRYVNEQLKGTSPQRNAKLATGDHFATIARWRLSG